MEFYRCVDSQDLSYFYWDSEDDDALLETWWVRLISECALESTLSETFSFFSLDNYVFPILEIK